MYCIDSPAAVAIAYSVRVRLKTSSTLFNYRHVHIVNMSYPVTEIAYIPIKDGFDVESGEGKSIWDATLKTIASQKGFKRLSWGKQIENPSITQMAIGELSHLKPTWAQSRS